PELRHQFDARHRFILVDEYQDTNLAQYRIVAALSRDYPNLCATGDPDQSIYGWRGARIENILKFEAEFSQARVVRLEENFRSTEAILKTADRLIVHNTRRKAKSLIATTHGGTPVELLWGQTPGEEAQAIARKIREEVETGGRNWSDFAILYRVNALSNSIERALVRNHIPYQVAVGAAFYDRTEIKDLLSYLRLIHNPDDAMAFRRVVNTPVRGIGKQTQNKLLRWAEAQGVGLLEAAGRANEIPGLGKKAILALGYFAKLIDDFRDAAAGGIVALLQRVLDRTGYGHESDYSEDEKDIERKANINELLSTARQYDETAEDGSLEGFLENSSLIADADTIDPEAGQVTLLTLHAAKGLEFPVVFIAGVEEGLLPHERSLKDGDLREIEEERRLLFVGITRARQELYLSVSLNRDSRGVVTCSTPSRFLTEMGLDRLDELAPAAWSRPPESSQEFAQRLSAPTAREASRAPTPKRPLLTTGASLLNGTAESVDIPMPFEVGMLVRHPREGVGRVVEVGMPGLRRTVTVEFDNGERASFVAAKCPLQPVGRK
ncbi:MAG TPA: 3'-5' exonuclease, partial [Planctomycetaceae bacterium]|nr:3'-5' exonuclease [Planctomycetaceae bacterium]